jgi:hypothetical protein
MRRGEECGLEEFSQCENLCFTLKDHRINNVNNYFLPRKLPMRIGEIKNILDLVVNKDNQIQIEQEIIFSGQAYLIHNFQELIEAYYVINKLSWNDTDGSGLDGIIKTYEGKQGVIQIDKIEFDVLNSYFASVNQKLPFFYSVLESVNEKQDEKAINIKLPDEISSLPELTEVNKRLETTLQMFNVDGEFRFHNFDKGTNWYTLVPIAEKLLSYAFLVGCLKIAQEVLKTRAEWFNSEKARISFEASKEDKNDLTVKKWEDNWIKKYIEEKVREVIKEVGERNNIPETELQVRLIKGTTNLIKELGEGTEFHLSLNPPEYASQNGNSINIDYKKIREIREKNLEEIEEKAPKILQELNPEEKEGAV